MNSRNLKWQKKPSEILKAFFYFLAVFFFQLDLKLQLS